MHIAHAIKEYLSIMIETKTATRSCRTRKRAFHFCSPGVIRRRHTAALHCDPPLLRLLLLGLLCIANMLIKNKYSNLPIKS